MKTFLLLLAAVTWAAASLSGSIRSGMSANREYWYEYDSQVLTGIGVLNKQYSGLKVRARVMLQKGADEYVTMKVSDCRVYKVKEDAASWRAARIERSAASASEEQQNVAWEYRDSMPDSEAEDAIKAGQVTPTAWIPESLLEELPSEHSTIIINELIKPMRIRYESGLITKVYADGSDPYWSVNMKKGILSLLYLDLNAANQVTDIGVSPSSSFLDVIRPDYTTMAAKTGFKVKEPSTIGSCETFYSLVPDHTLREIRVKKVPDTKKCVPKIMAESGLFTGILPVSDCPWEKQVVVEPSISTDYLLSGCRHDFLIKKALLSAKYSVFPSDGSGNSIDGFALQKLAFVKDEPVEHEVSFETTPVLLRSGLMQYVPLSSQILGTESQVNSARRDVSAEINLIDGLLDAICEKSGEGIDQEVPDMLSAIVNVLRKCSKEDIKDIVDTYLVSLTGGTTSSKKRGILLDVITTVPHPEIAAIVHHLIKEGIVSGIRATMMVSKVSMTVPPTPAVIAEYLEMARSPNVINQSAVHKAVVLGMGAICNKMVSIHTKMGIETSSVTTIVKDVVKELKSLLQSGGTLKRELAVKAMGNLGVPSVLSDLERIVKDQAESGELRKMAIYSCKKICRTMPKVITNLLLPIYMRQSEPTEVRVAAFLMIMECRPGYGTLHVISSSIEGERKLPVASFVYTYLQNLARTAIPELTPIKRLATKVLKVTRPISTAAIMSSGSKRMEAFSEKMQTGFDAEVNVIRKSRSVLPSTFVSRIHMHCFGTAINFGEIGVHMEGANEVLRKLIGTEGVLNDVLLGRKDIASVLSHLSRPEFGASAQQELERVLSKVDLTEVSKVDLLNITTYARMFDNEYAFMTLNKDSILNGIAKAKDLYREWIPKLSNGYDVNGVQSFAFLGNSMIIPTPLGVPLTLNTSVVGMAKAKGRVTLEGFSSIDSIWNGSPARVKVDIRPTVAIKMYHNMGITTDLFEIGTTLKRVIHVDVPIKVETEIKLGEKKIVVKNEMPTAMTPSAFVELKPGLYSLIEPITPLTAGDYKRLMPKITEIDCSKFLRMTDIEKEVRIPVVESSARVRIMSSIMDASLYDPMTMYFAKHVVGVSVQPRSSGEKVVTEIRYGESVNTGISQQSQGWFSGWWGSSEEEKPGVVSREEFVPVTPKAGIENAIERKVYVEMRYEGRAVTPMIRTKTVLISNPSMTKMQINSQVIAKDIEGMDKPAKVMLNAFVNVPNFLEAVLATRHQQSPSKDIASIEIAMGRESFMEGKITCKVLPYIASNDADIPEQHGLRSAKHLPVKSINLKIVADASDNVIENIRAMYWKAWNSNTIGLYKRILPMYAYMAEPISSISGSKAIICLQVIPAVGEINCIFANKNATTYVMGQPIPSILKPQTNIVSPIARSRDMPAMPAVSSLTKAPRDIPSAFYGICKLRPSHIETFDKLSMTWSGLDESCEIVLAHDCSPQKLYTVISSPVKTTGVRKIMVVIPGFKVVTGEEMVRGASSVKINDDQVHVSTSQPVVRSKVASDGSEIEMLRIERVGADRLIIKSPHVGVAVETDGRYVDVKLSPLLASSACGVCSHIPSVHAPISSVAASFGSSKVLAGPFPIRAFIKKYLVSSASCPASTEASIPSGECSTREENVMIKPNPDEVCFSVRPVEVCSGFCHASRSLPMSIGFHCMSATDTYAQSLVNQRHERIFTELINKVADIHQSIDIAQECAVNT